MISISKRLWGQVEGKDVYLIKIENRRGSYVEITNYGATLVSVVTPDKKGMMGNVVLGFPDLDGYLNDRCYIGSTIGRFGNRIGGACFTMDGIQYQLDANDQGNCNHSGSSGFNSKVFDIDIRESGVALRLLSKHLEGGFPGNLQVQVIYHWTEEDELQISYIATTDQKTVVSCTSHAYFNLDTGSADVIDHELTIDANKRLAIWADYVPTGLIIPTASLSFKRERIRDKMKVVNDEPSGINVFYVLNKRKYPSPACTLSSGRSGRQLKVFTSYPGMMLYTGDFLPRPFAGVALECQHFPDSPNHANFPSAVLDPGDTYHHHVYFKFGISPEV